MNTIIINAIVFLVGVSIGRGSTFSTASLTGDRRDCDCGSSSGPPPTREKAPASAFNEMNRKLYDLANEPFLSFRKSYAVGDVAKTGGGLHDSDRLLLASAYRNATSVFEYGLGESTHIAAHVGVPRLAGVDSDADWVAKARDGAGMDHFRFAFADVGALGPLYGRPANESLAKIPYDYQSGPLNNEARAFDVYLVDGRYRVACACASFLHALGRGGDMSKVLVLFHDWNRGKPPPSWNWEYWVVKDIADVVEESKLLAVLKLKSNATESAIMKLWERYMWDRR